MLCFRSYFTKLETKIDVHCLLFKKIAKCVEHIFTEQLHICDGHNMEWCT